MKQLHVGVVALVVALTWWSASVDAQSLATLRVKSEKTAGGTVTLVLQSGNVIEVLESDLYGLVRGGLQAPLSQTTPAPPFIAPPISAPVTGPTAGGLTITDRDSRGPGTRVGPGESAPSPLGAGAVDQNIRARCAKEWPADFRMQAYCHDQQNTAAVALGTRLRAGFNDTAEGKTITATCFAQWGDDYRMIEYCIGQQLEGLRTLGR